MARRRGPRAGQITLMPQECPTCKSITGSSTGLQYDQRTQTTYEGWVCSCGAQLRVVISGRTV